MVLSEIAEEMGKVVTPDKRITMINRDKKLYTKIQNKGLLAKFLKKFTLNVSGMISAGYLNHDEKVLYEELFYKNLTNEEVLEENIMMAANAKDKAATGHLKVPAFFYISDMKVPLKNSSWREFSIKYAGSIGI